MVVTVLIVFLFTAINLFIWYHPLFHSVPIIADLQNLWPVLIGECYVPLGGIMVTGLFLSILALLIYPVRGENNPFIPTLIFSVIFPTIMIGALYNLGLAF